MARRLAVVVSQSASSSAARRHLEESLITLLLLESGLDVSIVPNIPDLTGEQTGRLCLEGIQGSMVLVSWMDAADAHAALAGIGIPSRRGRTAFDRDPLPDEAQSSRLLYAINLGDFDSPDPICAEIRRIRDDLATPTVSIAGLATQPLATALPVVSAPVRAPTAAADTRLPQPPDTLDEDSDDDPALDRLVQRLEELDL